MPESADNKRTEEQNSIALEQEEQRDEVDVTPESHSETDKQEPKENLSPAPESKTLHQDGNQAEKGLDNKPSHEAYATTENTQSSVDAEEKVVKDTSGHAGANTEQSSSENKTATPTEQFHQSDTSDYKKEVPMADHKEEGPADSQQLLSANQQQNETPQNTLPPQKPTADLSSEAESDTQKSDTQASTPSIETDAEKEKTSTPEVTKALEQDASTKKEEAQDDEPEDESEDDDLHDDAPLDYSHYSKNQLTEATEALLKETDIKSADRKLNEIKTYFDEIESEEYHAALEKFLAEGGEKDGFVYKSDQLSERFHNAYKKLKERKAKHFAELEAEKETNLHARQTLLEKLRNLVDNEETNQSISELKALQQEWKSIGPAPKKYAKSLWASYNALVYRFYDNISIYYELKELDRRKNLEAKLHLCERAESLADHENVKAAIKELDTLHEEFKHIGPVPKDEQEPLWERFKAASDAVHARRREYVDQLKEDLQQNLEAKLALTEKVQSFADFDSDSIKAWNEKTREIRELQSQWEAIGGMPREQAKEVNKTFWSGFKKFFANKGHFFKKLDGMREDNLKKKEELLARAEALKESTDWQRTANELKQLQQAWKDIGPVPEKQRETIYKKFKAACDEFFNNRRASFREEEKDYDKNLKDKEAICEKIEQMATDGSNDVDTLLDLNEEYQEIGFVPKKAIKSIQKKYEHAVEKFLNSAHDLDEEEKQDIKFNLQFSKLKNSPNAQRKLGNKEMVIRKQISKLEDDLSVWKNNLNFFADSKKADKLKEEFGKKIEKADEEVRKLKQQLRVLRDM